MRMSLGFTVASLLMLALAASAAPPNLTVSFVQPENYADAGYSRQFASESERAEVQRDITQHLQRLAEQGLPADDTLSIEILDIDLAGRFEPFITRAGSDLRVVREITWPRIKLRYTLSHGDQIVASAEERLSDLNYLMSVNRYASGDRLRYEKKMLDRWFEATVVKR